MTIRRTCNNAYCYLKDLPDWGFLDDCFPGQIKMGDLDGIVERHGRLFIVEWKSEGAPLTKGQSIMFDHIGRRGDLVLVCWGDPQTMEPKKVVAFHENGKSNIKPTQQKIRSIAKQWFVKT